MLRFAFAAHRKLFPYHGRIVKFLEGLVGFEPTLFRLKGDCFTYQPQAHWWRDGESDSDIRIASAACYHYHYIPKLEPYHSFELCTSPIPRVCSTD